MSLIVEFWQADGPKGESLMFQHTGKLLKLMGLASVCRPATCVLVLLRDTRPERPVIELWRKPDYVSETGEGPGLLQTWAKYL